jgi:hypothetical protein
MENDDLLSFKVFLSARSSLASASGRSKKHSSSEAEILRPHQAEFAMGVCDRVWKGSVLELQFGVTPLRTALYIDSVLVALLNEVVSSCKREKVIPVVK